MSNQSQLTGHKSQSWLTQKYVDERLTTQQIAAVCGVSHKTISRYLLKFGIKVRSGQDAQIGKLNARRLMLQDIRDI